MSFNLTPHDYLVMFDQEHAEFQGHSSSTRKLITCCGLANSLPEIIFAQYGKFDPIKVYSAASANGYRDYLRTQCEAHHIVRDLCDFSKHDLLTRKTVVVDKTQQRKRRESVFSGLLALTTVREVERLVVTLQNGTEILAVTILNDVAKSWHEIFERDGLSPKST
jgi:hypothetical protein